jgi:glycosyltransferase involved in cell wall biosynthesis
MSFAFVSTWPPRQCGIAGYTRRLAKGLLAAGEPSVGVLAEEGGEGTDAGIDVDACYTRKAAFAEPIRAAAQRLGAQVVHVQHAPDLLGMGQPLLDLLAGLRADGRRVGLTLHTVHTVKSGALERWFRVAKVHRALGELAHTVVVHTEGSRDILIDQGLSPAKVVVIPHGTDPVQQGDAAQGRAFLEVPESDEVLLAFGFIHTQKNLQVLVRALARARRERPNLRLVLAGKVGGDAWYNHLYLKGLRALAARHGVADRLTVVSRFIDDAMVPHLHAAARLIAMPYNQGYASASGVVHGAMAMGVPMLCAAGPKFEEVGRHIEPALLSPPHDVAAWSKAIVRLAGDESWRKQVLNRTLAYAEATTWPTVARAHLTAHGR